MRSPSTKRCILRFIHYMLARIGQANTRHLFRIALLCAVGLAPMAGRGQHEEGRTRTRVTSIPVQNLDVPSDVNVISLSEQEFDDLFRQRSRVNGISNCLPPASKL